jgi:hypothetical protein
MRRVLKRAITCAEAAPAVRRIVQPERLQRRFSGMRWTIRQRVAWSGLNSSGLQNRSPQRPLGPLVFRADPGEDSATARGTQWGLEVISNQRYFARRALEEAARASRACSPAAQHWHQELAEKFGRLAKGECVESGADARVIA